VEIGKFEDRTEKGEALVNGAESLLGTLLAGGIDVCFMNPGTSEIHFVAALDGAHRMRAVPCLFEGVASGAADGYARMSGKPASTLFHLGPGLANALANLHNACRAQVPIVNIVGDHAGWHRRYNPPLAADIEAIARPFSKWLRTSGSAQDVARDCADAILAARSAPGSVATLILPADAAWSEAGSVAPVSPPPRPSMPGASCVEESARLLRNGARSAILLGSVALEGTALVTAGRIAAATNAKLFAPFAFARMTRGAGWPVAERIAYVTEQAIGQLREFRQLVLVGASAPVAFFAHPGQPSLLAPPDCTVHTLARPGEDCVGALDALALELDAQSSHPQLQEAERPEIPRGNITLSGLAAVIGAFLPEDAIVVDESITSGRGMMAATRGAPAHDWLVNTGGSIGLGIPLAVGAAIACPDRPVLCLEGDGSAMYTPQALWTAARENLSVTTIIFANRSYAILRGELANLGKNPGPHALNVLDIGRPDIDFVSLSRSLGVPAVRVATLEEFAQALQRGLEGAQPNLIEVPL